MKRSGRALRVAGTLIMCLAAASCGSSGTDGAGAADITGKWRIVQITENGRHTYDHTSASVLVELEFLSDGSALRITNQLSAGRVDTTAMTYARTPNTMTVHAPAETVTYEYTLAEDGNGATFTNAGRILTLQRVAQ